MTLVEIFHSKLNKVVVDCTEEYLLQKLQRFSLTLTICSEYCFIVNQQLREEESLHKVPYKVDYICLIWFKILKTHEFPTAVATNLQPESWSLT